MSDRSKWEKVKSGCHPFYETFVSGQRWFVVYGKETSDSARQPVAQLASAKDVRLPSWNGFVVPAVNVELSDEPTAPYKRVPDMEIDVLAENDTEARKLGIYCKPAGAGVLAHIEFYVSEHVLKLTPITRPIAIDENLISFNQYRDFVDSDNVLYQNTYERLTFRGPFYSKQLDKNLLMAYVPKQKCRYPAYKARACEECPTCADRAVMKRLLGKMGVSWANRFSHKDIIPFVTISSSAPVHVTPVCWDEYIY